MAWRDEAAQRVKEKSEGNTLKLVEGDNCFRILPDKKDILPGGKMGPKGVQHAPYREFRMHRHVGPDDSTVPCGKDIKGEGDCWLDDIKIPELEQSDSEKKRLQAIKIQPQEQFIVNASRFDPDKQKFEKPKTWWISTGAGVPGKASQSLAVRIYSKLAQSKKDYVDPIKGYNLNISRTGQGLKTRYPEIEGDESPSRVPAEILAQVVDLDKSIPVYIESEQKAAYFGRPVEDEEDEKPKKGKKAAKAAPVDEDEEESDSEELSEDEEELSDEEDEEELSEDEELDEEVPEDEELSEDESDEEVSEEDDEEEEEPAPKKKPIKKAPPPATKKGKK
jgi:hypothetical protein